VTAFRFRAVRPDGGTVRGEVQATSPEGAAAVLTDRGLFPFAIDPAGAPGVRNWRRPSAADRAIVLRSLAALVHAGVPLEQALGVTAPLASAGLAPVIERVRERVREGSALAAAMAADGAAFTAVVTGLIRAGERGVGLGVALQQAADYLDEQAELHARIRTALTYPLLLLAVGAISVAVIVLVVVPRFAAVLSDVQAALPTATRLLIAGSATVRTYAVPLVALVVGGGTALAWLARRQEARVHRLLGSLPVLGPLRRCLASSRACRTLGALLGSGVPTLTALEGAQAAAGDRDMRDRLTRVAERVRRGEGLAASVTAEQALTPTAARLLAIGERSSTLPELCNRAAALEAAQGERRVRGLVTVLEPALILVFAGLVAFIAAALLQAIYAIRPGG
jgi:general secretion pathway protein F